MEGSAEGKKLGLVEGTSEIVGKKLGLVVGIIDVVG